MSKTLSTQAITPRAAEFCRAAMTIIAAVLGIGALVLFVGVVISLRTASPSFGQKPAVSAPGRSTGIDAATCLSAPCVPADRRPS